MSVIEVGFVGVGNMCMIRANKLGGIISHS
jgi:hypothetical protein